MIARSPMRSYLTLTIPLALLIITSSCKKEDSDDWDYQVWNKIIDGLQSHCYPIDSNLGWFSATFNGKNFCISADHDKFSFTNEIFSVSAPISGGVFNPGELTYIGNSYIVSFQPKTSVNLSEYPGMPHFNIRFPLDTSSRFDPVAYFDRFFTKTGPLPFTGKIDDLVNGYNYHYLNISFGAGHKSTPRIHMMQTQYLPQPEGTYCNLTELERTDGGDWVHYEYTISFRVRLAIQDQVYNSWAGCYQQKTIDKGFLEGVYHDSFTARKIK